MNRNNFDPEQLNALLETVGKKLGTDPQKLRRELEQGRFDSAISSMSESDAAKFRMAVNDPKIVEKLMSTPQAQALYRKLTGGK